MYAKCVYCSRLVKSSIERPFIPDGGLNLHKNNIHQCPFCKQRWFCYDPHIYLWIKVEDSPVWKLLLENADVPFDNIRGICTAKLSPKKKIA